MLRDAAVSLGRHSQLTTRTGRSVVKARPRPSA